MRFFHLVALATAASTLAIRPTDVPADDPAPAATAELPRVTVSTTYPTGGRTVRVGANTNLQAALDAARPGDVLLLPRGATYVGNFVLRNTGAPPTGAPAGGWIVVRTDVPDAALGAAGTRMAPSRAAKLELARILSPNYTSAVGTAAGAHHWRLTGLEIGATPAAKQMNMLVRFGEAGDLQRTLAAMPHHLVVDRSYVHGTPSLDVKRCITLNSGTSAVMDSWLTECHSNNGDSQAILGYNGTGPFRIENNYLAAGHEVVMFGGGDPGIAGLVPSDIELRHNHITRPLAWRNKWQVKNLVETKNAQRLLVEGNVIENNWTDGQNGFAIVLKSENQDGSAPWSTSSDITVRYNQIRNTGSVFNLSGLGSRPAKNVPAARFLITHNVAEAVNVGPYKGDGIAFQLLSGLSDAVITHNTIINQNASTSGVSFDGPPVKRLVMHSNLFQGGPYGVHGSDAGAGRGAIERYAPGAVFRRNVIVGVDCSSYPGETVCPPRMTEVGFVSALNGNFRAGLGALRNRALDGGDIGADIDRVEAATRGAIVAP
ncbi:MAG: hypothetical protein ACJ79A_15845 [Gemmatimonadaceae bacterium]